MTSQKRKSLQDNLAEDFVFNQDEPQTSDNKQRSSKTRSSKSKLLDKFKTEPKERTKRFTIDIKESTHRKLSMLAVKTDRTKAEIVRMLIEEALEDFED